MMNITVVAAVVFFFILMRIKIIRQQQLAATARGTSKLYIGTEHTVWLLCCIIINNVLCSSTEAVLVHY